MSKSDGVKKKRAPKSGGLRGLQSCVARTKGIVEQTEV